MAQSSQSSNAAGNMSYVYLNQLEVGKQAVVKVMISRMWDTHTPYGKYLSSDFIASDEKMGNVIQLTAKHNIAHHFITRLKEGSVYLLKDFEVVANRDEYRILRANNVIIQLQGSTYLDRQAIAVTDGYIRHPFDCIEIEDLVPTERKYLIDVVGRVTNVGSVKPQRNGFSTMEFELANERGHKIPMTLSGGLDVLAVSSSSSTMIIDDSTIPTLHDFVEKMSTIDLPEDGERRSPVRHFPLPKEGTLAELLDLVRKGKHNILDVFKLEVELAGIRLQNGWYYTTCSICKSKRERRERIEVFTTSLAKITFRIEFDVRDATGETVVVVFDELGEQLTNTTAPALLLELEKATCRTVLPNALANLIHTKQVLLLKAHSYYNHGIFESFNCIKVYTDVVVPETPPTTQADQLPAPTITANPDKEITRSGSTTAGKKRNIAVPTPSKDLERTNRHKFIVTSDSEEESEKSKRR
ncbi:uncharacterized protein [Rutidosis leptorrhynchoides]|uniref:uncharacterized protein n=1 Tax=Rutidosis leptorrhynchoides TaxID=125765 RepID=UPI003A99800C